MKRMIVSSNETDGYNYYFKVYELDEDGEELDPIESFDDLEEAIKFATDYTSKEGTFAHIVMVLEIDPDDDPDLAEWYEYNVPYEPYEEVWTNFDE